MSRSVRITEATAGRDAVRGLLRAGGRGRRILVVVPAPLCGGRDAALLAVLAVYLAAVAATVFRPTSPEGMVGIALAVLAGIAAALTVWRSRLVEIEEGSNGIVLQPGKPTRVVGPGRHVLAGRDAQLSYVVDMAAQVRSTITIERPVTSDGTTLDTVEAVVSFRVVEPATFARRIGPNGFAAVLEALAEAALRRTIRSVEVDTLEPIVGTSDWAATVRDAVGSLGVELTEATITEIRLPVALLNAHEALDRARRALDDETVVESLRSRRRAALLQKIELAQRRRDELAGQAREDEDLARAAADRRFVALAAAAEERAARVSRQARAAVAEAEADLESVRRLASACDGNPVGVSVDLARRRLAIATALMLRGPRVQLVDSQLDKVAFYGDDTSASDDGPSSDPSTDTSS